MIRVVEVTSDVCDVRDSFLDLDIPFVASIMNVRTSCPERGSTVRRRVGALALGSTRTGLLIGAALIVCMPACASHTPPSSSARGTPRFQCPRVADQVGRCGSPATIPRTVEWRFSEPQPDWKSALSVPGVERAGLERTKDALRVTLSEGSLTQTDPARGATKSLDGSIYLDLPDWRREEWADVLVSARTTGSVNRIHLGLNPAEGVSPAGAARPGSREVFLATFQTHGGATPIVRDGLVHTYRIHPDWGSKRTGPWRRLGLMVEAQGGRPGSMDILSVRVVPAAADGRVIETILEPAQLKSDFALFRRALEEAHPALYRYKTKRELDAEFAKAEAKLTRPMTILQFRNVLAPVLAAIEDGHIGFTNFQGDEISTVINSAKQFPLALAFESKGAFVVLNQGLDDRVKPGMEVLAINGAPLAEILHRILPNMTHDGDIRSWQMYLLGISRGFFQYAENGTPGRAGFSEAYRLYIDDPQTFRTTLRDPRTRKTFVVELAGVTVAEAAVNVEKNQVNRDVLTGLRTLQARGPQQSIRYLDSEGTAILVPGFRGGFPDFIGKAFAELKSKGTKNLIIDMRGNTGGFDLYPRLLFSHLTSKEFRSGLRVYIKTYQPSFKQYTDLGEIDPVTDPYYGAAAGIWKPDPSGGWLMTEKYGRQYGSNFVGIIGVQKPAENHFDGTVYVLTDAGTFSAGSAFCGLADRYKRAIFIGELETGGAAKGGTGGGDIGPTLPDSHLHFNISMEAAFPEVDKSNLYRGTLPKYTVVQTIDDLAKGRDTVLEFTRELIRSGKGH